MGGSTVYNLRVADACCTFVALMKAALVKNAPARLFIYIQQLFAVCFGGLLKHSICMKAALSVEHTAPFHAPHNSYLEGGRGKKKNVFTLILLIGQLELLIEL